MERIMECLDVPFYVGHTDHQTGLILTPYWDHRDRDVGLTGIW